MKTYVRTDKGRKRSMNQDSYYVPIGNERFVLVADGMGGHKSGDVASRMAVMEFCSCLRWAGAPSEQVLTDAVARANKAVFDEAQRDAEKSGMGTTLTALWMDKKETLVAHVGDSRAYLIRNGSITQITRDHTLVSEMIEQGTITYSESLRHPMRHYITRAVGTGHSIEPDILRLENKPGDIWLLCTDGLSNYVSEYEMASVMNNAGDHDAKVQRLLDMALDRGGSDNITVIAVTGEEDG